MQLPITVKAHVMVHPGYSFWYASFQLAVGVLFVTRNLGGSRYSTSVCCVQSLRS